MNKVMLANFTVSDYESLVNSWLEAEQAGEQFPVPFDAAWQMAGYKQKGHAKRKLEARSSYLKEGRDYIILRGISKLSENRIDGRFPDKIFMTFGAFVILCVLSGNQNLIKSALFHYISDGRVNIDWTNPTSKDKSGFVYLVQQSHTRYYKIGCSKKPYQRLQTLQCGNPLEIKIIERVFSLDCYTLEKTLQNYYQAYAVRGEWFDFPVEIVKEFYRIAHDLDKTREESASELTTDTLIIHQG